MNVSARWIVSAVSVAATLVSGSLAFADLDAYVQRDDGAFSWSVTGRTETPAGTISNVALRSQVWQGIPWNHKLRIYEPAEPKTRDTVLLFITGGSQESQPKPEDAVTGFTLAQACGATCAVLPQVPNQPLLGGKTEDTLIAETFVRYLETKDESWPLLFPMVKSAVRAMDAVQAWAKENGKPPVTRFVVTGASKRGWTTWLTGASDKRVIAIAPMVIDTLNMKAQKVHALEVWGKYSEQIDDYTSRGLTEKFDTDDGRRLWLMVDPYTYRDRLTIPKLLINGTNDRYWTLDALNIYWDDLKGPKSVVYLPNAGHGLQEHRDYALNGVGALFRHAVSKRPMPDLRWTHSDAEKGGLKLLVRSDPEPKSARLWVARSDTRDFRESHWDSTPMLVKDSVVQGEVAARPEKGFIALFDDLEYEIDGLSYHLSTQIRQTGAKP